MKTHRTMTRSAVLVCALLIGTSARADCIADTFFYSLDRKSFQIPGLMGHYFKGSVPDCRKNCEFELVEAFSNKPNAIIGTLMLKDMCNDIDVSVNSYSVNEGKPSGNTDGELGTSGTLDLNLFDASVPGRTLSFIASGYYNPDGAVTGSWEGYGPEGGEVRELMKSDIIFFIRGDL